MRDHTILRYTAFTDTPDGGNPAGVWLGETLPEPETMRAIAREVGYSETAFAVPTDGNSRTVRYYSPEAEVAFCGHATIALGVVLGESEGPGVYRLLTAVGEVPVEVRERGPARGRADLGRAGARARIGGTRRRGADGARLGARGARRPHSARARLRRQLAPGTDGREPRTPE